MNNPKDISIKSLLAERGITPKTERGGTGMYLSPFRVETTPSFKVDYCRNLWYDFGIGEGGSIIDLVMRLDGLSFHQAATKLEQGDFSSSHWSAPTAPTTPTPKTEIISTDIIKNRHLIAYLEKRAINLDIAQRYCREVHYLQNNKPYFAIGFKSDGGGWELRNEYYKGGTSPKAPTTIKGSTNSTMLFEGFMDMLAYLTLIETATPMNNVCVLNSVSNLSKAVEFLRSQQKIYCFLDNDPAGSKALFDVHKLGVEVIDQSNLYKAYKDVNDYLLSVKSSHKVEQVQQPKRGRRM
ncbi:MAG: toprim domain-containing protein [Rikenellaceae bacterium]